MTIAKNRVMTLEEFLDYDDGTEIVVEGDYANTRIPDLMILTGEGNSALAANKRSMVMLDMPAPALVVEVVSSSDTHKESRDRDYNRKRKEYAERGIAEYWLVDPIENWVLVWSLKGRQYTEQKCTGEQRLVSATFPKMELTAKHLLNAGRPV